MSQGSDLLQSREIESSKSAMVAITDSQLQVTFIEIVSRKQAHAIWITQPRYRSDKQSLRSKFIVIASENQTMTLALLIILITPKR